MPQAQDFTPPHPQPAKIIHRYLEKIMHLTNEHPILMRNLLYAVGAAGLLLGPATWALEAPVAVTAAAATAGTLASAAAGVSSFVQRRLFGFPLDNRVPEYQANTKNYGTARGEIIVKDHAMPLLRIQADKPYDAGYVEGYLLGSAIQTNLKNTDFLYPLMRVELGAPKKSDLKAYLNAVLETIPAAYQDEMQGKVKGYNDWLAIQDPKAKPLTFEHYLLMQLLPDLHNYNPFRKSGFFQQLKEKFFQPAKPQMACTTIALRLGEYTFLIRVLDWPSHNVAGKSFLQVDRQIGDAKRTIDIGLPLLSGATTVLNTDGLLIEINIADGDKVTTPAGMPAVFFNRYMAEHAATVADIDRLITEHQPLGPYHLTASDGQATQSFHFYQHAQVAGAHATEVLPLQVETPQLLVVANNGLRNENGKATAVNHRDSNERKNNITQFFQHESVQQQLKHYLEKQKTADLDEADLTALKAICLQVARLPLVCNDESVLCALYVYHHKLIDASAATDNLYVGENAELNDFQAIMRP